MTSLLQSKRNNDILIKVRQNSESSRFEVKEINEAGEKLFKCKKEDIIGHNLYEFLSDKVKFILDDNLNYENDTEDFAQIIRKIPSFHVKNTLNEEVPVGVKVFHLSPDRVENPEYEILMKDITLIKKIEELKAKTKKSNQQHVILDTYSLLSLANVTFEYNDKYDIASTFAAIDVSNIKDFKLKESEKSLFYHKFYDLLHQATRYYDVAGFLNEGNVIGNILVNCNSFNAKRVYNRVLQTVKENPIIIGDKKISNIDLRISYISIDSNLKIFNMVNQCLNNIHDNKRIYNTPLLVN